MVSVKPQTEPGRADLSSFAALLNHHVMLNDHVRMQAYRKAIERHAPEKVVMDLGCGSGVLSLFAAMAGAKEVIAVEATPIADLAYELFRANGLSDRIRLERGHSSEIRLGKRVDLIIHELIGYLDPLDEDILPTISDASRRFLAPAGRLLPYRLDLGCVGYESSEPPFLEPTRTLQEAESLEAIYGLRLGPFIEGLRALPERYFLRKLPSREEALGRALTDEENIASLDLKAAKPNERDFRATVTLNIKASGQLTGFRTFFRAHLDETLSLTNAPSSPKTHWGRGNVDLVPPLEVVAGEKRSFLFRRETPFGQDPLITVESLGNS